MNYTTALYSTDERTLAVFVDFENLALGFNHGRSGTGRKKFDSGRVLDRLVEKGKIFGEKIFRFIDADKTQTFSYANFLMEIPSDFAGVSDVAYDGDALVVREDSGKGRTLTMEVGTLFPAD